MAGAYAKTKSLIRGFNSLNDWIGRTASWLILFMVVVEFLIVVLRYFFRSGQVWIQETVIYCHGIVFLVCCARTLLKDAHVRVDILYQAASPRKKALINLLGSLLLLLPTCLLIAYQSWPYVAESWRVFEGSKDGGGLEAIFLLKSLLIVFALLTALQGISLLLTSFLTLKGESLE